MVAWLLWVWAGVLIGVATVAAAQSVQIMTDAPIIQAVDVTPDPATRLLSWTPGRCTHLFRAWVFRGRWRVYAETTETSLTIPVKRSGSERWRVSAVCDDLSEWVTAGAEIRVNAGPWDDELP
jgi:hypothetical protein